MKYDRSQVRCLRTSLDDQLALPGRPYTISELATFLLEPVTE